MFHYYIIIIIIPVNIITGIGRQTHRIQVAFRFYQFTIKKIMVKTNITDAHYYILTYLLNGWNHINISNQ